MTEPASVTAMRQLVAEARERRMAATARLLRNTESAPDTAPPEPERSRSGHGGVGPAASDASEG